MRVLILSTCRGKGFGAEVVLRHLLEGWDSSLADVSVASPSTGSVAETSARLGIPHIDFPLSNNRIQHHAGQTLKLKGRLDLKSFDVVHAWTAREFELALMFPGRWKKSGTLHDHPRARFHGASRQWLMRQAANRLDALACVSRAVAEACLACRYRTHLEVLHNGLVDFDANRGTGKQGAMRIGFLGMYADWKGFEIVLDWIRNTSGMSVDWLLFGEPTEKNRALCRDLPANATLMGWCPPEKIWGQIDLLVHASDHFDPLPTVLIEAARAGIPCLASARGGAGEIVTEGVTGFLFDPTQPGTGREKLQELIASPELTARMGRAARSGFEANFRVDRMVQSYLDFWNSLL